MASRRSRPMPDSLQHRRPCTHPPQTLLGWGESELLAAWTLSERLHRGQTRKYSGQPYVTHPYAVCRLLRRFRAPQHVLMASLLHDALEDLDVSLLELERRFSFRVALLVMECSRITTPADGTRAQRLSIELARIRTVSPEAQSILLADVCHNSCSIVRRDRRFAAVYIPEKQQEVDAITTPSIPELRLLAQRIVTGAQRRLDCIPTLLERSSGSAPQDLTSSSHNEPSTHSSSHQHHWNDAHS